MAVTLVELKSRLAAKFSETDLLEILDLHADQIVEAFSDLIEEDQEKFEKMLDEDEEFAHDYQA